MADKILENEKRFDHKAGANFRFAGLAVTAGTPINTAGLEALTLERLVDAGKLVPLDADELAALVKAPKDASGSAGGEGNSLTEDQRAEIATLVKDNNRDQLVAMADPIAVEANATKAQIAELIVLAKAADAS